MANASVKGFWPVKHISGSPYNGQVNIYAVATNEGTAIGVGDLVKINGGGLNGYTSVTQAAANGVAVVGPVVGVVVSGLDPVSGKMSSGASPTLDTPQYIPATPGIVRYVLVADDPELILETQANGTTSVVLSASIGLNYDITVAAASTVTGRSAMMLDGNTGATTNTLPLRLMGFKNAVDNDMTLTNAKVYVMINTHQYKQTTGVTGVA
jgi:hypothetical protein